MKMTDDNGFATCAFCYVALNEHPEPLCSPGVVQDLQAERDALKAANEQLRYERRLLGWARMTLDLVAAGDHTRWEQARREAKDIAQRIVDEIGHPVTDEPALGPSFRAAIDRTREAMERYSAAGCTNVNIRQVINLLSPTWPDGNYDAALDDTANGTDSPQENDHG